MANRRMDVENPREISNFDIFIVNKTIKTQRSMVPLLNLCVTPSNWLSLAARESVNVFLPSSMEKEKRWRLEEPRQLNWQVVWSGFH